MSKKIDEGVKTAKAIMTVIVMIVVSVWIFSGSDSEETETETKQEISWEKQDYSIEAWVRAKEGIEPMLVSPSTADWKWDFMDDITKIGQTYTIDSYVDSENVYGGKIRTYFVLIVKRTEFDWNIIKFEMK